MSRRNWVQIAMGLIFGGTMIAVAWVQFRDANALSSEATVLLAADSYLRTLEAVRDVYTSEVVDRLPESVQVTYDYDQYDHAVPLPATFTMALAANLGASIEGLQVRLYSEYPFPFRGPTELDDFERLALDSLKVSPSVPVSAVEGAGTDRVLRYARADTMRLECVACHNSHPESPKTDWEVGALRGVLAISVPMASFDARAREARRPYTMLLLLALIGLLGAAVMLLHFFPNLPGQGRSPPSRPPDAGRVPNP
jgi:adenylate cyclase